MKFFRSFIRKFKKIIFRKTESKASYKNTQLSSSNKRKANQILRNIYLSIGFNNLNDFKKYLIDNKINFENVKNKLKIEAMWNELILIKFSSKVKIDEEKLRKRIIDNSTFLKSYLLSEISFEVSNLQELNKKYQEIIKEINSKDFTFAALKYSMSPTSNLGGKLDWINENSLNENIREVIKNLEINDITKPINVPGGFLILQINDIKNTKIKINIEEQFKKLENYEKNNQLNQYSKIYFNKIKKDLEISEL